MEQPIEAASVVEVASGELTTIEKAPLVWRKLLLDAVLLLGFLLMSSWLVRS